MSVTGKYGKYLAARFVIAAGAFAVLSVGVLASQLRAADEPANSEHKQGESQTHSAQNRGEQMRERTYLGIQVEGMRPGLIENEPQQFASGQGVRVEEVTPGSPADKAGIKSHDIVMCFDDQKLFSPLQLVGLVRGEKQGREAELTILRDGKTEKIKVTLGEREMSRETAANEEEQEHQGNNRNGESRNAENRSSEYGANGREEYSQSNPSANRSNGNNANEETFDSLLLENIGKNQYRVQVQYLDKEGKLERHKFEGTIRDLRQKIQAEKDLPPLERSQLIRSLELPSEMMAVPSVTFRTIPRDNEGNQSDDTF